MGHSAFWWPSFKKEEKISKSLAKKLANLK